MLFYDFEVFAYDWLVVIIDLSARKEHVIINDADKLRKIYDSNKDNIWAGFNSRGYDQYIMKGILCGFNPKKVNDFIIAERNPGYRFSSLFRTIPLNNYDVMPSPPVGLKTLEAFMGHNIKETSVPFDIDRPLTEDELAETVKYCRHDVEETVEVFLKRIEEFESHISLIKAFKLPLSYVNKTKVQLSAIILGAVKKHHNDEFELQLPPTLRIEKYKEVVNWYKNPLNRDYRKSLNIDVSGVPHVFAWGGIHGAISKYSNEGYFLNIDVASYYPALMIEYGFLSRNVSDPEKFRKIRDDRLKLKAEKNPMQAPYKIVINGTYGAMKDQYNALFDPRQANNVCVGGQLLLLDLIERLEGHCQLIQSNTDGLIIKMPEGMDEGEWYSKIDDLCYEWECRTRMELEFVEYRKIYQKDVNNYLIVPDGPLFDEKDRPRWTAKGAYVKALDDLDYDLPIVNKALVDFFLYGTLPEETIRSCNELREFQKVVKVSSKYLHGLYSPTIRTEKIRDDKGRLKSVKIFEGGEIQTDTTFRVFASKNPSHGGIFKVSGKTTRYGQPKNPEKFANTPERCFIDNHDITTAAVPDLLDRDWYIDLAWSRLQDFGIERR